MTPPSWIFRDSAQGEKGDIELDVRWENWSRASDTEIIVDAQSATKIKGLPFTARELEEAIEKELAR